MSKQFEKKFKLQDCFDKEDGYHLWMLSFSSARQDLFYANKKLNEIVKSGDDKQGLFYFLKMNIGHLNEAVLLIKNAFKTDSPILNELIKINNLNDSYIELIKMIDGNNTDSIYKNLLSCGRNNFFHYNKGKKYKSKESDFQTTKESLENLYHENHYSGFVIGEKMSDNNLYFADEVQLNYFFKLGQDYKLTEEKLFEELGLITAKVISILSLITDEFLIKIANGNKGYNINCLRG